MKLTEVSFWHTYWRLHFIINSVEMKHQWVASILKTLIYYSLQSIFVELNIADFQKYLEGLPGGARPTQAARAIARNVEQYLQHANAEPSYKALLDTRKIEDIFFLYQGEKCTASTRQEKLRSLRLAIDYIKHLLLS